MVDERVEDMVEKGVAKKLVDIVADEERDLTVRHYCLSTLRNISLLEKNKVCLLLSTISTQYFSWFY